MQQTITIGLNTYESHQEVNITLPTSMTLTLEADHIKTDFPDALALNVANYLRHAIVSAANVAYRDCGVVAISFVD